MIIRTEIPDDFDFIYHFVKTAFSTAKVSDGDEQNFVNTLRKSKNYLPELALVAEIDGHIVGHIMLTKTYVQNGNDLFEGLLLAPLAVEISQRNKGIGSALIREASSKAKAMGYTAIFLAGDPDYYGRFGFKPTANFGIRHTFPVDDRYIMVCKLIPDCLENVKGTVQLG